MPSHTPGPWTGHIEPVDNHAEPGNFLIISGKGWEAFAKVVVRMSGATEDEPAGIANASLILNSPDLLAAARAASSAMPSSKERDALDLAILRCEGWIQRTSWS